MGNAGGKISRSAKTKRTGRGYCLPHWIVVIIASCGWLFDCMDQRIIRHSPGNRQSNELAAAGTSKETNGDLLGSGNPGSRWSGWATAALSPHYSDKWAV
jgi:hypothetical protein